MCLLILQITVLSCFFVCVYTAVIFILYVFIQWEIQWKNKTSAACFSAASRSVSQSSWKDSCAAVGPSSSSGRQLGRSSWLVSTEGVYGRLLIV